MTVDHWDQPVRWAVAMMAAGAKGGRGDNKLVAAHPFGLEDGSGLATTGSLTLSEAVLVALKLLAAIWASPLQLASCLLSRRLELPSTTREGLARGLRADSDFVVELDSNLRFVNECQALAASLLHGGGQSLKGGDFMRLVVKDDREQFQSRVGGSPAGEFCVRLRDSIRNVVHMKVLHVAALGDAAECAYLVGMSEVILENEGQLPDLPSLHHSSSCDSPAGPGCCVGQPAGNHGKQRGREAKLWIEITSPGWRIARAIGACSQKLWGLPEEADLSGALWSRCRPEDFELARWISSAEIEEFIGWVQEAYCQMMTGSGPAAHAFAKRLQLRPPPLQRQRLACSASVVVSMALGDAERPSDGGLLQLHFQNIRLVRKGASSCRRRQASRQLA